MSNLRAMRKGQKSAADHEALAMMTLEELSTEKVMFGDSGSPRKDAHSNKPFKMLSGRNSS